MPPLVKSHLLFAFEQMLTVAYYWRQNVETLFVRSFSLPPPSIKQNKMEAMTTCTPICSINIGPEERGAAFQQLLRVVNSQMVTQFNWL